MKTPALALLAVLLAGRLGAQSGGDATPIALIQKIVVDGQDRSETSQSEVRIVRARTGEVVPARRALALFTDDEVATGANASLVLLYAINAAEEEKTALVGEASQVRVRGKSSLFLALGRVLANVRGLFEVERPEGALGARGTEFEVVAAEDGATRLLVLEGSVRVALKAAPRAAAASPTAQPGIRAEVAAGASAAVPVSFSLRNGCQQEHTYELRAPDSLSWVSLVGERFLVDPGARRTTEFVMKLDASRVGAGVHRGEATLRCLDCDREPGCAIAGEPLVVEIVVGGAGGRPAARADSAGDAASSEDVERLQEVVLRRGEPAVARPAAEASVRGSVDWSSDVLLAGRPAYSRPGAPLYFPSVAERDRSFRGARLRALLDRSADAYQTLGDIYCDWGQGAKGLDAYQRAGQADRSRPVSPDYLAGLAESYRLKGRLEDAEARVRQALSLDPRHGLALLVLGNLRLDQSDLARDRGEKERARERLEAAARAFDDAAKAAEGREAAAVARANRGRAYLALGDLDRGEGRVDAAQEDYENAERAFRSAQEIHPPYPYPAPGLADVQRGYGHVALARGDRARALASFRQSQEQYLRAIREGFAPAAAWSGLGALHEELGRDDRALDAFRRALELKPDAPLAYRRVGMLLAKTDPERAAPFLRTYLDLEAPEFKQGARALQAERTVRGEATPVAPPSVPSVEGLSVEDAQRVLRSKGYALGRVERQPSARPEGTVLDQQPDPGRPAPPGSRVDLVVAAAMPARVASVRVPDLEGDKEESAVREIEERGLTPRVVREAACDKLGRVRRQEPGKDASLPKGSAVTIVVASAGDRAVGVPRVEKLPRERAESVLARSGLRPGRVRTRQTSAVDPGTVLDQDPEAGAELAPGCPVDLVVAEGVPLVDVPDFRGMSEKDALARLGFLGSLLSHLVKGEIHGAGSGGVVYDQNPKPGSRVPSGTAVELWIRAASREPETTQKPPDLVRRPPRERVDLVEVPDVRNYPLPSALQKIRESGLKPISRSEGGCVESQDPAPGARVLRNSEVRLGVGPCPIR